MTTHSRKRYRKKSSETTEENETQHTIATDNVTSSDVDHLKLLQTKELQKLRGRSKGVNAGVASDGIIPSTTIDIPNKSLNSTFTVQQDKPEVNKYMELYVEEMMKKKKEGANVENNTSNNNNGGEINDLFTSPEHLKTEPTVSSNDATNWLTGIVEVQLPVEYKLKNIEETEKAKREIMQQDVQSGLKDGDSFANIRYQIDKTQRLQRSTHSHEKATDDLVMDRFKKRFRK